MIKCTQNHIDRIRATLRKPKAHSFHISQGSVAAHLRCGGIFDDSIVTRFLLILTVK